MPGVCALFGTIRQRPSREAIKALAEDAQFELIAGGGEADTEWTRVGLRRPDATLILSWLGVEDDGFERQVLGATQLVLQLTRSQPSPRAYELVRKIAGTRQVIGVAAEPNLDAPGARERCDALVTGVARAINGVVLREARLLDPELRVLLGPGEPDPAATLTILPSALERKQATEAWVGQFGIPIIPDLPAIEADEEVLPREPREVARRAQALWAVVSRANGIERKQAIDLLQQRGLWDAATDEEAEFLLDGEPEQAALATYRGRAEALWALLWTLGRVHELGPPMRRCDPDEVNRLLMLHSAEAFVARASLRETRELLDQADLAYRCHATAALAHKQDVDPPANLDRVVARERHAALFWVLRHMNQPWDAIVADEG